MDPFDVLYKLVYQLTHRTLGSNDVANDPKLLKDTLAIYTSLDDTSAAQIMFPWFPVPSKLRKMWAGAKLHWAFEKIMNDRRRTGRVEDDAMQELMDAGEKDLIISAVSFFAHSLTRTFVTDLIANPVSLLAVYHGCSVCRSD